MEGESQFLMSAPPYNHQLLANPSTFYICTDPLLRKRLNARKETDLLGHRGPAGTQNLHPPLLGLFVLISNISQAYDLLGIGFNCLFHYT